MHTMKTLQISSTGHISSTRHISSAMRMLKLSKYAVIAVAVVALVGCGSGSTGGTETGVDGGGSSGADTGAAATTDTGGGGAETIGGAVDTVDPCADCADNEICEDDKCVPKQPPVCGGPCPKDEACDKTADGGKGKCVKLTCTLPTKFNKDTNKISKITIPSDAKNACDLNDDGKPDNALGAALTAFSKQVKDGIDSNVLSGDLTIILEPSEYKTDGKEFDMNVLIGVLDPSQVKDGKPTCDTTKDTCKYQVETTSYDLFFKGKGQCPPIINFNPSKIVSQKLTAGGPKQLFLLKFPVLNLVLEFKISSATLDGDVKDDKIWKETKNGRLCGMITKKAIDDAIDKIPEEELLKQGFDKATVKALVGGVLSPDIDADEDGKKESVSVLIEIETVPADITGIAP